MDRIDGVDVYGSFSPAEAQRLGLNPALEDTPDSDEDNSNLAYISAGDVAKTELSEV